MKQSEKYGISDLTTSEGYLKRFSLICKLIQLARVSGPRDIISVVREQSGLTKKGGKLTHPEVIMRHVRIMSHIGVLNSLDEGYTVSSEGKALIQLIGERELIMGEGELSREEKVFYFVRLFGSVFWQLYLVLLALFESDNKSRERLIADYFVSVRDKGLLVWSHRQISEDLDRYNRRGELPATFKNRFECMSMWLTQLGLIREGATLTSSGREFMAHISDEIEQGRDIFGNPYSVATIYVNGIANSLPRFPQIGEQGRRAVEQLLDLTYTMFETPDLRMSDARAVRAYLCVKLLLEKNIVLEEQDFDNIIYDLANKGLIRSVMTGRNGKLAYIRVG